MLQSDRNKKVIQILKKLRGDGVPGQIPEESLSLEMTSGDVGESPESVPGELRKLRKGKDGQVAGGKLKRKISSPT